MAKTRAQKEELVAELDRVFSDSGAVVVCHYAGLTVAEMTEFRNRMRAAGGAVRVAKNRLARIALKGKDCEGLGGLLTGQTVLAYAEDPVTAAKVVEAYAKDNQKMVILGGALGAEMLNEEGVKALAKMPSHEEIIAQIAATLTAPASKLSSAIGAPAGNIAGCLNTLAEKEDAAA